MNILERIDQWIKDVVTKWNRKATYSEPPSPKVGWAEPTVPDADQQDKIDEALWWAERENEMNRFQVNWLALDKAIMGPWGKGKMKKPKRRRKRPTSASARTKSSKKVSVKRG